MAMRPKRALTLPAPAKLNLFLHVTGQRRDGYHTLETLFVLIGRGDTISLALRDDGEIVRQSGAQDIGNEMRFGIVMLAVAVPRTRGIEVAQHRVA